MRPADSDRRLGWPPSLAGVHVAYQDRVLQQRIRQGGGRWVRKLSLWVLLLGAAKRLKLEGNLVSVPDAIDPAPEVDHEKPMGINKSGTRSLS